MAEVRKRKSPTKSRPAKAIIDLKSMNEGVAKTFQGGAVSYKAPVDHVEQYRLRMEKEKDANGAFHRALEVEMAKAEAAMLSNSNSIFDMLDQQALATADRVFGQEEEPVKTYRHDFQRIEARDLHECQRCGQRVSGQDFVRAKHRLNPWEGCPGWVAFLEGGPWDGRLYPMGDTLASPLTIPVHGGLVPDLRYKRTEERDCEAPNLVIYEYMP